MIAPGKHGAENSAETNVSEGTFNRRRKAKMPLPADFART